MEHLFYQSIHAIDLLSKDLFYLYSCKGSINEGHSYLAWHRDQYLGRYCRDISSNQKCRKLSVIRVPQRLIPT